MAPFFLSCIGFCIFKTLLQLIKSNYNKLGNYNIKCKDQTGGASEGKSWIFTLPHKQEVNSWDRSLKKKQLLLKWLVFFAVHRGALSWSMLTLQQQLSEALPQKQLDSIFPKDLKQLVFYFPSLPEILGRLQSTAMTTKKTIMGGCNKSDRPQTTRGL